MRAIAKSLRRRAVERIKRSEQLAVAYQPRRWRWYKVSAACLAIPISLLIYVPVLGFILTILVLGPIAFEVWDGKPTEYRPSAMLGLAAHAHVVGGILALMLVQTGRNVFCDGLPWLAYFPHRDLEGVRRSNRKWIAYLLAVGGWSYYVFRCVGIYHEVSLPQLLLLVLLAALQAAIIYATAVVAVGLIRPTTKLDHAMSHWAFLSLLGYAACMLSTAWPTSPPPLLAAYLPWPEQPPQWLPTLASYSGLLLPTGWVDAVVWYGVLQGHAWGWLFLLPCAALSALALWCRPRLVSLREIRVSSQGQLTPVFADDPEPEATEGSAAAAVRTASNSLPVPATNIAPSPPLTADRQAVLKRLLNGPPLGKTDWSSGWPLERLLGRLLSERERALAEHCCGGCDLTLAWLCAAIAAAIWTPLVLLVAYLWPEAEALPWLISGLVPLVAMFVGLPGAVNSRGPNRAITHPQLPIGLRETSIIGVKVALFGLLCGIPLMVLPLALVVAVVPVSPGMIVSPLIGTSAGLLSVCAVAPTFGFANHTRYEPSVHRFAYLIVLAIGFFGGLLMAPLLILTSDWPVILVLAIVVLFCVAITWLYFNWLYHSGRLDYVDWRPPRTER